MTSLGARAVKAGSSAARMLGNALDNFGASLEVAKYSERLVPSTRFVAVDGVAPKTSIDCAFVAPSASLIGDVTIGSGSSVWYGAAIRGDVNKVTIGEKSSIGDRAVVHVAKIAGDYPTIIGSNVTVGPGAIIHACTLENNSVVGASAQVLDGAVVESFAMVAPGAVVPPKMVLKGKSLYAGSPAKAVRELTEEEIAAIGDMAQDTIELAYVHAEECAKDVDQLHEDELEMADKAERDPEYLWQPREAGETDRADVQGMGVPGLIFDDALKNPAKWLKLNEKQIKEKFAKEQEQNRRA